ncbi:hypothetical protein DEI81_11615 [Curtobacterium sp. MCBD17_013]|uniref:hypothetical protein n=1 Tax=Curtobacterium sp. MCBD17_013 TaxID=2175668 RepID=UPI000DA98E07|nr:hypothetical protein [Curtobacterium sp. MCBD17_013]PZF61420.1 hypothetical protein DEI81_11615 [Curtobacterium sp. MCBD17_013]
MTTGAPDRFAAARWVTVERHDAGRWSVTVLDEADDEIASFGMGVEGEWEPDVVDHVAFALTRLGLRTVGARPWREDELGLTRAAVLPA